MNDEICPECEENPCSCVYCPDCKSVRCSCDEQYEWHKETERGL